MEITVFVVIFVTLAISFCTAASNNMLQLPLTINPLLQPAVGRGQLTNYFLVENKEFFSDITFSDIINKLRYKPKLEAIKSIEGLVILAAVAKADGLNRSDFEFLQTSKWSINISVQELAAVSNITLPIDDKVTVISIQEAMFRVLEKRFQFTTEEVVEKLNKSKTVIYSDLEPAWKDVVHFITEKNIEGLAKNYTIPPVCIAESLNMSLAKLYNSTLLQLEDILNNKIDIMKEAVDRLSECSAFAGFTTSLSLSTHPTVSSSWLINSSTSTTINKTKQMLELSPSTLVIIQTETISKTLSLSDSAPNTTVTQGIDAKNSMKNTVLTTNTINPEMTKFTTPIISTMDVTLWTSAAVQNQSTDALLAQSTPISTLEEKIFSTDHHFSPSTTATKYFLSKRSAIPTSTSNFLRATNTVLANQGNTSVLTRMSTEIQHKTSSYSVNTESIRRTLSYVNTEIPRGTSSNSVNTERLDRTSSYSVNTGNLHRTSSYSVNTANLHRTSSYLVNTENLHKTSSYSVNTESLHRTSSFSVNTEIQQKMSSFSTNERRSSSIAIKGTPVVSSETPKATSTTSRSSKVSIMASMTSQIQNTSSAITSTQIQETEIRQSTTTTNFLKSSFVFASSSNVATSTVSASWRSTTTSLWPSKMSLNGEKTESLQSSTESLKLVSRGISACVLFPSSYQATSPSSVFTDINECSLGTNNCHTYATCTNTIGAFTCSCKTGFAGNGVLCSDIDECALGSDTCSTAAFCFNTMGSYSCQCKVGYSGNGRTCSVLPTAATNCFSTFSVNEGGYLKCLCSTLSNDSSHFNVSWSKDGKLIKSFKKFLVLKNISRKDAGKYKCKVETHNKKDEKHFVLIVNYKPTKIIFKTGQQKNSNKVTVECFADAHPPAKYTILFNGKQLTDVVNGTKTFDKIDDSNSGEYQCLAKNHLGSLSKNFYLIAPGCGFKVKNNGTKWYIVLITIISGLCIGIMLICAVMCLRRWFKTTRLNETKDQSTPQAFAATEIRGQGPENVSEYQELDLRRLEEENTYQSLQMNSETGGTATVDYETEDQSTPQSFAVCVANIWSQRSEDVSEYQELDLRRLEEENTYQALQMNVRNYLVGADNNGADYEELDTQEKS